jgi:TatD DNase family protein
VGFVDTHCHLQMKSFTKDMGDVVDRASRAGVDTIINVGFDVESSKKAIQLSNIYPMMFATVGIHPHEAASFGDATLDLFDNFLKQEKVVAIGEIGLDFKRNLAPPGLQLKVFKEQLAFAHEKNVPVVLHIRDSYRDVIEIIEKEGYGRILMHCFCGNIDYAKRCLSLGGYISFAGNITYPHSSLPEVAVEVPISRILVETDAPFLTPVPYRGDRNEPSFIIYTAQKLSEIKKVDSEEIAKVTSRNAVEFFQLKGL